jgi:hypothetical protein
MGLEYLEHGKRRGMLLSTLHQVVQRGRKRFTTGEIFTQRSSVRIARPLAQIRLERETDDQVENVSIGMLSSMFK